MTHSPVAPPITQDDLAAFATWLLGDLRDNTDRAKFAEWLVARALGADTTHPRDPWAGWDVLTPDGITVEVKCTGLLQSWSSTTPSPPGYHRLITRAPEASQGEPPAVRAQVYVFGVHLCRDSTAYNVLDVTQWEFRVVPGRVVAAWNQKSIRLAVLQERGYTAITYADLAQAVTAAAATPR
ncbi:hypothetical protein BLA60_11195 [Actinophytocola xinjiangensis]|uniref:Uncharacterized protein n=1 Tax=Actinophytocola xinjiangensis TaxID=485602 RepID=A0A7Z0WP55_9PSEU|nr:hypothetical protein [Actinophytocola xinjiangensis]OLF11525.1 hypothetical protein BLA60_11195 [Actinophytocola xinjiangensis]